MEKIQMLEEKILKVIDKIKSVTSENDSLNTKIAELHEELTKKDDELLTREETANYLKINPTTLWHWTNKGKLISYGIGSRRYYKKQEVIDSLVILNVKK